MNNGGEIVEVGGIALPRHAWLDYFRHARLDRATGGVVEDCRLEFG